MSWLGLKKVRARLLEMQAKNPACHFIYKLIDPRPPFRVRWIGCTKQPWKRLTQHLYEGVNFPVDGKRIWISNLVKQQLYPKLKIIGIAHSKTDGENREARLLRIAFNQRLQLYNVVDFRRKNKLEISAEKFIKSLKRRK